MAEMNVEITAFVNAHGSPGTGDLGNSVEYDKFSPNVGIYIKPVCYSICLP
jgi:hypothetical protein